MDAAAELAALRARAYGPDADIHRDPKALARLAELEGLAHADAASALPSEKSSSPILPSAVEGRFLETPAATSPGRRRRRVPVGAVVGAAAVVGMGLGLVVPWLMAPKVVAQLHPSSQTGLPFPFGDDFVPIDPTTLVRYDDFDRARVWSADNEDGRKCLFVAGELQWANGCVAGELEPTVDIDVSEGTESVGFLGLPSGSLVRLVLRGDVVDVWIAETAAR